MLVSSVSYGNGIFIGYYYSRFIYYSIEVVYANY